MKKFLLPSLALALLASQPSASAQSILLDFNAGTPFPTELVNQGGTANWFGVGGVNNSGYLNNNGSQPSLATVQAFANVGDPLQTSFFFKSGNLTAGSGSNWMTLGFNTSNAANAGNVAENTVSDLFGVRLVGAAGAGEFSWNLRLDSATGSATNPAIALTTNFTINSNEWYRLSASFTKGAADTWNFTTDITPFGADGITEGSILSSAAGSFTQSGTYNAAQLYGNFNFRGGFGPNITSADNYAVTAVPEPSTYAICVGALLLGVVALRRRRAAAAV